MPINVDLGRVVGEDALVYKEMIEIANDVTTNTTVTLTANKFNREAKVGDVFIQLIRNTSNNKSFLCIIEITNTTTGKVTGFSQTDGVAGNDYLISTAVKELDSLANTFTMERSVFNRLPYEDDVGVVVVHNTSNNKDYFFICTVTAINNNIATLRTDSYVNINGKDGKNYLAYDMIISKNDFNNIVLDKSSFNNIPETGDVFLSNIENTTTEKVYTGAFTIGNISNNDVTVILNDYVEITGKTGDRGTNAQFDIVDELPPVGDPSFIYLVEESANVYTMYLWDLENEDYVDLGTLGVDLSNYYTKLEIDARIDPIEEGIDYLMLQIDNF